MLVARQQLAVVAFRSVAVRFLDRPSRRRVVARDGQTDRRAVRERDLTLDQSLAVGAAADDRAPVVVLKRSGQNLARRGTVFVDQHDQLFVGELSLPVAVLGLPVSRAVLRVDDHLVGGQELVRDRDGLFEQAARVAPDVEDELLHALSLELSDRFAQFFVGVDRELIELDIADIRADQVRSRDAFDRNGVAPDGDRDQPVDSGALDSEPDFAASRPPEPFHYFVLVHFDSGDCAVLDRHDPVSSLYACLGARSAGDDVQHDDRVGRHVEHDADAVELSFDRLVGLSEVLRAEIHRMRVEIFENQRDDFFRERVHPYRVDILRVDQAEQHVELIGPGYGKRGPACRSVRAAAQQKTAE